MSDDLAPERVAELAEAVEYAITAFMGAWAEAGCPTADDDFDASAEAARLSTSCVAPLVAGWLAEAEAQRHPLWGDGFLTGKVVGAAEVRERVEHLAGEWEAEADDDERWLNGPRVEVSEAHELPALIRQSRAHARDLRALAEPGDQSGEAK